MNNQPSIPDHDVKCNMCEWQGYEEDLEILYDKNEAYRGCPNCKTDEYLSDIDEECPYLRKDMCSYSEPCPNDLPCKGKVQLNPDGKNWPYRVELKAEWEPIFASCERDDAIEQAEKLARRHEYAKTCDIRVIAQDGRVLFTYCKSSGGLR